MQICDLVKFPLLLDMEMFISDESLRSSSTLFNLLAVIVHIGTIDTGHYIVYVKGEGDLWYKCNDDWVTKVDVEEVLASEAYILFYMKENASK